MERAADGMHDVRGPAERALIVGVEIGRPVWSLDDSLAELAQLAKTAGVTVIGEVSQKLGEPNSATLVGKGKLEEIRQLKESTHYDMLLFDEELSPRQQRSIEEAINVKVLDRTALILDIFARHARTREGRLQVELAQLEYRLPRLTRLWTHLSRQTGGTGGSGVGLRGPGETQLEVDRRRARERIGHLKDELKQVHGQRELYRQQRRLAGVPIVALVGYTNAGKSTLLNALSDAGVLAADVLFATLDPTTRQVALPDGREILLTDTVGFIQRLPTQLVAAFRATLEEIAEADLLIHVLDITHANAAEQAHTVEEVLKELGLQDKPRIVALNKIDKLIGQERAAANGAGPAAEGDIGARLVAELGIPADHVPVSAQRGIGLDRLLTRIEEELKRNLLSVTVRIPYNQGDLVAEFHRKGTVVGESYDEIGTVIAGYLPRRLQAVFAAYIQ
ncbi:MAG: GTPase HflX [Candidatus Dormibacteraeota bacterium]|nr:GTPase HflX [Candidatus Dormibacteraeota bacterium]